MLMQWMARGTALLSCVLLLLFIWGGIQEAARLPSWSEMIGLAFFPVGVMLGLLLGWKQPTYGGWIAIFSLVAFYSWHLALSERLPRGPYFILFTVPALLYLLSGWLSNHRSATTL